MKLDDLKPDPQNARKHSERNLDTIRASLEEFGATRGIVVDENGTVLAGNGVLEAARAAGIDDVQMIDVDGSSIVAIRVSHLTPGQKARYAIADNRTTDLSEWDTDVLAGFAESGLDLSTFWTEEELAELVGTPPDVEFPEFDEESGKLVMHVTCPECGHSFPR